MTAHDIPIYPVSIILLQYWNQYLDRNTRTLLVDHIMDFKDSDREDNSNIRQFVITELLLLSEYIHPSHITYNYTPMICLYLSICVHGYTKLMQNNSELYFCCCCTTVNVMYILSSCAKISSCLLSIKICISFITTCKFT